MVERMPELVSAFGIQFTVNMETLKMTWLTMVIVILIAFLATRSLSLVPKGWQMVLELIVNWLNGQVNTMMGKGGSFLAPFIVALFLFLIVSNWIGLVPGLASPTNDLNTTLALAAIVIVMVHVLGVYKKGMHYIAHFFQPTPVFVIINAVEEIAKPITLSCRLFGNILAGEILIHVLLMFNHVAMALPSVCWLAFSIFIGGVQAVIFTMLSTAYLANAVKVSEEHAGA